MVTAKKRQRLKRKMTTLRLGVPPKFLFLHDPPLGGTRWRILYGGRGGAKSWQIARALIKYTYMAPLRILCAREFQASIKDSVHKLLENQIDGMGLGAFFDIKERTIVGANGSEFIFKGLRRNIREIKSTEGVDICWIEEAEAVSAESWRILPPTIRKPGSELWASFNPALETDPTYRLLVTDPPRNALIQFVTWEDNPWLDEEQREDAEDLRRRDPQGFAHVWGGEPWRRSEAEVLDGKWIVDDFTPQPHWDGPYYGADWGFSQDPSICVRVWISDSRLYVEYDEGGVRLNMDATERMIRSVPGAEDHKIRADGARPETINEMVERGLKVVAAPKWSGSVEDGVTHLQSYEMIVIHPRCKRAAQEARMWRYKTDDRTGDPLRKLMDGNDHVWDGVRYALSPIIQIREESTISFGTARM